MAGEKDFCDFLAIFGALKRIGGETHNCFLFSVALTENKRENKKLRRETLTWFERGMEDGS